MINRFQILLWGLFLVSCAGLPARAQSGEPDFAVTTKNNDDRVSIQHDSGTAYIDVYSPRGIGSATFELEAGGMPEQVIVRLHLTGLEQFRLTSARDIVSASVSSGEQLQITQTLLSSGGESPIAPGDPLWMEIEVISGSAEPAIPLREGYFEVLLPEEFLRQAGRSFEVQWIDFYR